MRREERLQALAQGGLPVASTVQESGPFREGLV
jgi:hypothetical protein